MGGVDEEVFGRDRGDVVHGTEFLGVVDRDDGGFDGDGVPSFLVNGDREEPSIHELDVIVVYGPQLWVRF